MKGPIFRHASLHISTLCVFICDPGVCVNCVISELSFNLCTLMKKNILNPLIPITKDTVSERAKIRNKFGWFDCQAIIVPQVCWHQGNNSTTHCLYQIIWICIHIHICIRIHRDMSRVYWGQGLSPHTVYMPTPTLCFVFASPFLYNLIEKRKAVMYFLNIQY